MANLPGSTKEEARKLVATIEGYWARKGINAAAEIEPVYNSRGILLSYAIKSKIKLVATANAR